jgi:aquaporin Z
MISLKRPGRFSPSEALRHHWPEYLIEAWALGMFMISASLATTELEYPAAFLYKRIPSAALRLGLIGVTMGATAVTLIYSSWGKRSGAHMNPAVTLAFLSLGRISPINAAFYILAQFAGGLLGVLTVLAIVGKPFSDAPVHYIVTQPGPLGTSIAFLAELAISCLLMLTILFVSNQKRWSSYTGIAAGILIACYVSFESPLSGMSMNPARTLASALPAREWSGMWIYFVAPPLGMWLAALIFRAFTPASNHLHRTAKIVPTGEQDD